MHVLIQYNFKRLKQQFCRTLFRKLPDNYTCFVPFAKPINFQTPHPHPLRKTFNYSFFIEVENSIRQIIMSFQTYQMTDYLKYHDFIWSSSSSTPLFQKCLQGNYFLHSFAAEEICSAFPVADDFQLLFDFILIYINYIF